MNPLSSERDAFRLLILVIGGALGVGAAGVLGDGWTALATVLALLSGVGIGLWVARQRDGASPERAARAPVPGLTVLVVTPAELAGPALAREVVAEEGAASVRAVVLAGGGAVEDASRSAAELRALFEELGVAAQAVSVASEDAERAVAAELRDGVLSHVLIATHRRDHPSFAAEERLVHAIDGLSETPVVAVAFAVREG